MVPAVALAAMVPHAVQGVCPVRDGDSAGSVGAGRGLLGAGHLSSTGLFAAVPLSGSGL